MIKAERADRPGMSDQGCLGWLLHPVSVLAMVLLLLNDQVLKAAWPGLLTGKLSDVAGLALAPPVITATLALLIPRLPVRLVAGTATVAVGTTFALVKTTAAGAAAASAAWSWAWGPSTVLRDPTDLLALPSLALSWWAFGQVRRHPLPRRAVDLISAVIVLPIAGLALLATSANDYPRAGSVSVDQDRLLVMIGSNAAMLTTDGESWNGMDNGQLVNQAKPEARTGSPRCVPAEPRHCYRTVPERLAVQQSVDGGSTWTDAWSISPGRQRFLGRAYPGHRPDSTDVAARGLGILPVGDQYVVVVAAGRDGVVVRHPDGRWERIGFPTVLSADMGIGAPESPAPLTQPGQRIAAEYIYVGMAVSVGLLLGGLGASRSRRSWWLIPLCAVLFGYGLAMAGTGGAVLGASSVSAAMVLIAIALVAWVSLVYSGLALSLGRAVLLAGLGAATVVAGTHPFVDWSAGRIDAYESAQRAATLVVSGGVGVMTLVGLGLAVRDWRRRA